MEHLIPGKEIRKSESNNVRKSKCKNENKIIVGGQGRVMGVLFQKKEKCSRLEKGSHLVCLAEAVPCTVVPSRTNINGSMRVWKEIGIRMTGGNEVRDSAQFFFSIIVYGSQFEQGETRTKKEVKERTGKVMSD